MGRHDGAIRDGQFVTFGENFQAHALLPPWTIETLFNAPGTQAALLRDGMVTDREALSGVIQLAFPQPASFDGYAQAWGSLQSARVVLGLKQFMIRPQYADIQRSLADRYQKTLNVNINRQLGRYQYLAKNERKLLEEVTAFRGGSYFTCAVVDQTEQGANQIKTYDLLALIANAELGVLTGEEFWELVNRLGVDPKPFERQKPVAYFRLRGFLPERTNYAIKLQRDLLEWGGDRFGVAMLLDGVTVETEFSQSIPGLNEINQRLRRQQLPALLCMGLHPLQMKRQLRLPLLFAVYPFVSRDASGLTGTIAFGREALLLDVALRRSSIDCGGTSLIL